jgi:hypothetical protein
VVLRQTQRFLSRIHEAFCATGIHASGGDALSFLPSTLETPRGNAVFYNTVYRAMPAALQRRMSCPLLRDDIRAVALRHIGQMPELDSEEFRSVADHIARFDNPRLRMQGFATLVTFQTNPAFPEACRRLLDDEHPGIRLQAAIFLGQSAIQGDPGEARLFPILMSAIKSKGERKPTLDLQSYRYQQHPPGGTGLSPWTVPPGVTIIDPDESLTTEILRALYRLERYMPHLQKLEFRDFCQEVSCESPDNTGSPGL